MFSTCPLWYSMRILCMLRSPLVTASFNFANLPFLAPTCITSLSSLKSTVLLPSLSHFDVEVSMVEEVKPEIQKIATITTKLLIMYWIVLVCWCYIKTMNIVLGLIGVKNIAQ